MTQNKTDFDFDAALQALREGGDLTGKDGVLTSLIKQLTEVAMHADLDSHMAQDESPNRKNGSTPKTVKGPTGGFELHTPRDRAGSFEPQLAKKNQTHLTDEIERKILALFFMGTSYQDIRGHIGDLYGIKVSNGTLNAVTDPRTPALARARPPGRLLHRLARRHPLQGHGERPLYLQCHLHHPGSRHRGQKRARGALAIRSGHCTRSMACRGR